MAAEYKIVIGTSVVDMEGKVNALLVDGWQLSGDLIVLQSVGEAGTTYQQVMVK